MAKKNSTPGRPKRARTGSTSVPPVDSEILRESIEAERGRLMTAEALLHCIVIAMDDDDCQRSDGPHYQSVIDVARDLINQSINQLDSINLRRVDAAVSCHASVDYEQASESNVERKDEVKEGNPEYLH